mmetsp:Transcript_3754/g.5715  ORF Transcript_3754/g.5715 Transcript_3754/m.5715 type:complete len:244 (+) Transcript_3754:652-1383(+)
MIIVGAEKEEIKIAVGVQKEENKIIGVVEKEDTKISVGAKKKEGTKIGGGYKGVVKAKKEDKAKANTNTNTNKTETEPDETKTNNTKANTKTNTRDTETGIGVGARTEETGVIVGGEIGKGETTGKRVRVIGTEKEETGREKGVMRIRETNRVIKEENEKENGIPGKKTKIDMNKTALLDGMIVGKSDLQSKMLEEINKRGAAGLRIETTEEGRTKSGVRRADIRMGGRLRVGGKRRQMRTRD